MQSKAREGLHVAIIMDGNGRWATRQGLPRVAGHRAGVDTVRRVVEHAPEMGIGRLTLYAFSSDNWSRPPDEVQTRFSQARLIEGPAECTMGSNTPLRREQLEGQDVNVIQFATGRNRVTVWQAPKLGCEYLYDKAEVPARDGSFRIDMEVKTTKLVIGEPEARLFEVAPDLVEMKPSEALRKLWSTMDPPVPTELKPAFLREEERVGAEQDKRYEAAKSRSRQ